MHQGIRTTSGHQVAAGVETDRGDDCPPLDVEGMVMRAVGVPMTMSNRLVAHSTDRGQDSGQAGVAGVANRKEIGISDRGGIRSSWTGGDHEGLRLTVLSRKLPVRVGGPNLPVESGRVRVENEGVPVVN